MFTQLVALAAFAAAGANAHLFWYAPMEGMWSTATIAYNNKLQCNTFTTQALPGDTLMITPGASFASPPYNVSVNAHGGGNTTMQWIPCTTGNATGTRTYGTTVNFAALTGGATFPNVTTEEVVPVAGTYPSGITGWGIVQMTSTTVLNGAYIGCRWAYTGVPTPSTTTTTTTTSGSTTTTTTSSGSTSTTGSKSDAATVVAGFVTVAAAAIALA